MESSILHCDRSPPMETTKAKTLNVAQLGVAFSLVFFAFNSTVFLLEWLLSDKTGGKHVGYNSLAIIYITFSVGNIFSAWIVSHLGSRYAMTLGSSAFAIFQAGFFFFNQPYLYISSILVGIGAALLWEGTF